MLRALAREELIDLRLAALRQDAQGVITPASVESLFLWQPLAHGAAAALDLVAAGRQLTQQAADHAIAQWDRSHAAAEPRPALRLPFGRPTVISQCRHRSIKPCPLADKHTVRDIRESGTSWRLRYW
jgi:hypothetical protein